MKRLREPHTFTAVVTIEMTAPLFDPKKFGGSFEVEVEFRAWPDQPASWDGPATEGDREIVEVRVIKYKLLPGPKYGVQHDGYRECPQWLEDALRSCVDVDALEADWSQVADEVAEHRYQMQREAAE